MPSKQRVRTTPAAKIANHHGLTIGQIEKSDPRRRVPSETAPGSLILKPYFVARNGNILAQFGYSWERMDWLKAYDANSLYPKLILDRNPP